MITLLMHEEIFGYLGSVHILRHHVKGGKGIPDTIDNIDNALKGGGTG